MKAYGLRSNRFILVYQMIKSVDTHDCANEMVSQPCHILDLLYFGGVANYSRAPTKLHCHSFR